MLPDPVIEEHEGFLIVRDDLIPGGSKRRALGGVLTGIAAEEFVYPSTAYGHGPLALAYAGRDIGKKVRLFYAARLKENWTPLMRQAEDLGAKIVMVRKCGYMPVVQKQAREYCARHPGSHLLPMGFDTDEFRQRLAEVAKSLPLRPKEVWCASGSGALTRALQDAWPDARHHAVVVARKDAQTGNAVRHVLNIEFTKAAKEPPPFPSAPNYDAKVWAVMKKHASRGALFWNVGA